MRPHWGNCLTHFDDDVKAFVSSYFSRPDRRCLLVAGAGFDPRAGVLARGLASVLGARLEAFLIREERGDASVNLRDQAEKNEADLRAAIPQATVAHVPVFADDGAPVGGARVITELSRMAFPEGFTDVILDMSAISIGLGFPAARFLLARCEASPNVNFHLMISSNPGLDSRIIGEPADRAMNVRGFSGEIVNGDDAVARIWLPQLASGQDAFLTKIQAVTDSVYKVCPILPFPADNPRTADDLIAEYGTQLKDEWQVDARDLIYVSERNPLDSFRTISTLKERYDETVRGVYVPQIILSPLGSKVMAAGAMMAAIEHGLSVQYVETIRYDFDTGTAHSIGKQSFAHVWLHGPIYAGYVAPPSRS